MGARHKATIAAEALLDGEAEALTRKAVEMALSGDGAALRLCLDRIYTAPPRAAGAFQNASLAIFSGCGRGNGGNRRCGGSGPPHTGRGS